MYRPDWDQMDLGVPIPDLLFNEDLIANDALVVDLEEHLGNAQYGKEDDIKREKIDNFFNSFFAVENQLKDAHTIPEADNNDINDISLADAFGDIFYDEPNHQDDSMQGSPNSSASGSMSEEETQALIEDMEEFLTQHETFDFKEVKMQDDSLVTDAETDQAEKILDALLQGDVSLGSMTGGASQLGNGSLISNISEIVGANGQKIYIVITNDLDSSADSSHNTSTLEDMLSSPIAAAPSPQSSVHSGASSPYYSSQSPASFAGDDASDSDWSPVSPQQKSRGGRMAKNSSSSKKESAPRKKATVDSYRGIKDKRERKKVQNVHAARRYREKKKNEQGEVEAVEEVELTRNRELKAKLSEMESEVKTLKKLMAELGLVKLLAPKK